MKLPHLLTAEVTCLEATKVILYTTGKERARPKLDGRMKDGVLVSFRTDGILPPPLIYITYTVQGSMYTYTHT